MQLANKSSSLKAGLIALLGCCLIATGCTTTRPVFVDQTAATGKPPDVSVGERVIVTLRSGGVKRFRVESVEADALYGKGIVVPYRNIELLEKKVYSSGRTWGLVGGVAIAVAGMMAVLVAAIAADSE